MRRTRTRKVKGSKRVSYELINPESLVGAPMYRLLRELVDAHHEDLADARIALAWCTSWRPDVDGRVTIGKCRKASDLDRELAAWDFIILVSKAFWQSATEAQRGALLDHELSHASVRCDDRTGEPVRDERGRKVYRIRRHDLEEFAGVVERHGTYKKDLEAFAAALRRAPGEAFAPCDLCVESPGWVAAGDNRVARCECWIAWRDRGATAAAARAEVTA